MMAVPFGTAIPTIVVYRISLDGPYARVRVLVGETALNPVGVLLMSPSEFHTWRASLRDYDPARFATHYAEGAWEWLHSGAAREAEAVPQ